MTDMRPSETRFSASTSIQDCDVADKDKLRQYREKWSLWMSWYESRASEPSNIQDQIHRMFFDDITYRSVASVRKSVPQDSTIAARNPTLMYLLDQGYVARQVFAILRLLDKGCDVLSLPRLLKDVKSYRNLITREIYVSGDGAPYNYEACLRAALAAGDSQAEFQELTDPVLSHAFHSERRHKIFDFLSGKQEGTRTRTDTIQNSIFNKLKAWLNSTSAKDLKDLRDKFLAHSADSDGRRSLVNRGLRFSQIDGAQKSIVKVERAIIELILDYNVPLTILPTNPRSMFSGLNHPYAPESAQQDIHKHWENLAKERNDWAKNVQADLIDPS